MRKRERTCDPYEFITFPEDIIISRVSLPCKFALRVTVTIIEDELYTQKFSSIFQSTGAEKFQEYSIFAQIFGST